MLAIRKKEDYIFNEETPSVIITSGLTYDTNTILGSTAIEFDINNSSESIRIANLEDGKTYFLKIYLTPNPDTFYDATDELRVQLTSGANTSGAEYAVKDDESVSLSIETDGKSIYINLSGDVVAGQITGWIDYATLQQNKWEELDIEASNIKLNNAIKETTDLNKIQTQYSSSFPLIMNKRNIAALGVNPNILTKYNNVNLVYEFRLTLSDYNFDGWLEVTKISKSDQVYIATVNLYSKIIDFITDISDQKLNLIKGLTQPEYVNSNIRQHSYSAVTGSQEYCYIMHDYGQNINNKFFSNTKGVNRKLVKIESDFNSNTSFYLNNETREYNSMDTFYTEIFSNNFYPSYFAEYMFRKIHTDYGFSVGGDLLDIDAFSNLLIMPSNLTEEVSEEDYALKSVMGSAYNSQIPQNTLVTLTIPLSADTNYDNGSINSNLYEPEHAMYCGFDYEITISFTGDTVAGYYNVGGEFVILYDGIATNNCDFVSHYIGTSFEENEVKEVTWQGSIPSGIYIPEKNITGGGIKFILNLTSIDTPSYINYRIVDINISNVGKISDRVAPTATFNSEQLLPNITKFDFVKQIITMFNLYPTIENNKIIYNTYDNFYTGSTVTIDTRDIDVTEYQLPQNFVANKYKWNWRQNDNIGDIKYFNDSHENDWGSYSKKGINSNDTIQEYSNPFGITYHRAVELDGGTVLEMGVSSANMGVDNRYVYIGDPDVYFYNSWEPIPDDVTFGIWTNMASPQINGGNVAYITEYFTTVDIDNINTAVYSEGSDSLLWSSLYDNYYKTEIQNLTNVNALKIKFKAYITEGKYAMLELGSLVKLQNAYFHIESIKNFNGKDMAEFTLIKVNVNPFYTS